jgi:Domain of unknown function (DUF5753)
VGSISTMGSGTSSAASGNGLMRVRPKGSVIEQTSRGLGNVQWAETARMIRQSTLQEADPAPDVAFILDEAVIRRVYGGPEVMRAQLARLVNMTLTPTTVVQILPFAHGGHALAGGSLALMTLDDGSQVAYEEAISTGTLIDDTDAVSGYRRAYDLLRACALSPKESAAFIRSVMEELPI